MSARFVRCIVIAYLLYSICTGISERYGGGAQPAEAAERKCVAVSEPSKQVK
jgi:hypothetical protein